VGRSKTDAGSTRERVEVLAFACTGCAGIFKSPEGACENGLAEGGNRAAFKSGACGFCAAAIDIIRAFGKAVADGDGGALLRRFESLSARTHSATDRQREEEPCFTQVMNIEPALQQRSPRLSSESTRLPKSPMNNASD
jgi:hypothetical protein